jgi:hypothetical protein
LLIVKFVEVRPATAVLPFFKIICRPDCAAI